VACKDHRSAADDGAREDEQHPRASSSSDELYESELRLRLRLRLRPLLARVS
jgi:hypothetical protein